MLKRAYKWAKIQREVADSMTVTWTEFVPEWKKMLQKYKQHRSMPNPKNPKPDPKLKPIPNPFEEPNPSKNFLHRNYC
jgi:hypothetical protein